VWPIGNTQEGEVGHLASPLHEATVQRIYAELTVASQWFAGYYPNTLTMDVKVLSAEVEANDIAMLIDNCFTHVCFQLACVTGTAQERWTGIWRPEELRRLPIVPKRNSWGLAWSLHK